MKPIVRVENLSKQYSIGTREAAYDTLRESIAEAVRAPLRRLRGRNGKRSVDTIWALKDASFEVEPGEVVGIIGRNGAGKSTLLKVLSRITEPTTGRVELFGRLASLLEVGTGFHPELTGRENIYLNGAILGMRKTEIARKFDEIVAFSELRQFLDTPVKRYSSGMYMRLAFAVASHLEPEILLVDEVLAVGDASFQKKCLGKMGDVAKEGRTVLFVSHNMTAVKSLCRGAIWLDTGKIVKAGEVNEVVADYLQHGTFSVSEQLWEEPASAPGNESVRIRSARVVAVGDDGSGITVETPLKVVFEFWNYEPGEILNLTLHVYTIEGTYVFAAGSNPQPTNQGLFRQTVTIPANLLNDGTYSITIQIVKAGSLTVYLHQDILTFEVHDAVRTGNWFGKWPGVVRPKLNWVSEVVAEKEPDHEHR